MDEGKSWQLVGLLSLLDPPREDSASTIQHALQLGVQVNSQLNIIVTDNVNIYRWICPCWNQLISHSVVHMIIGLQVKMVTGDQLAIGKETSRRLGLGNYECFFWSCIFWTYGNAHVI